MGELSGFRKHCLHLKKMKRLRSIEDWLSKINNIGYDKFLSTLELSGVGRRTAEEYIRTIKLRGVIRIENSVVYWVGNLIE